MKRDHYTEDDIGLTNSQIALREAFAGEETTILAQAEVLQREKPKVVVLFNKHYPLEPLSEAVNLIRSSYPPKDVSFMEVSFSHTPLGEALANYQFLVATIGKMANGVMSLTKYGLKDTTQFSLLLKQVIEKLSSKQNEIALKHQEGFLAGELYVAVNKGVRTFLNPYLEHLTSSVVQCAGLDYGGMLRALRTLAPYVPEEEFFIQELSRMYPAADYVSMHGGFVFSLQYQEGFPHNHVYANVSCIRRHAKIVKALYSNEYYRTVWDLHKHEIGSERLRRELDLEYFEHHVNYAFLELPLGCCPADTTSIKKLELTKAIIASFLLPSPYCGMGEEDKRKRRTDMDYFRKTVISDEHRALLAQDIREYLDLMLKVSE